MEESPFDTPARYKRCRSCLETDRHDRHTEVSKDGEAEVLHVGRGQWSRRKLELAAITA